MLGMNARNIDYVGRYNDRSRYPLVDDKLRTKLLAKEHGVSMPALRLVLRAQHELRGVRRRLEAFDSFACKPAKGAGGRGIWVIERRDGDRWVKASGRRVSARDVTRHFSNTLAGLYSLSGNPDAVLLEDLIVADDCFSGYSVEGVPDIRVIVFRGYPVMAMVRLSTHASDGKANLHQGAVGVGLALADGRCLQAVQFGRPLRLHPDTGRPLGAIRVPGWQDLLLLAARCYDMTGLGFLGADLVIDRRQGPQLLELNARPGLAIQVANGCGLLPRLRRVEALDERRRPAASERVAWARDAFAGA